MTRRSALLALIVFAVACAAPKQSWQDLQVPEAYIELLPRGAVLELDHRRLGPGSRSVPVPDPRHRYQLRGTAAGFQTAELAAEGEKLTGARVMMVLRPDGFGAARRLDGDEPSGLAQAAAVLLRTGRLDDARDYADRSLEVGNVPLAHRVLGSVSEKRGDRKKAAQHYSDYLMLVPDAPDAKAIAAAIERARGDFTIPVSGDEPNQR